MYPLKVGKSIKGYQTPFYKCYESLVEFLGFSKTYYVVDFKRTAAVICINDNHEVLLTSQYRFLINNISLEIAGGGIEDGENFMEGAARELLEETGYCANELIPLCAFRPGLDNVDNPTEVFLCKSFTRDHEVDVNPSEILGLKWLPINECLRLISAFEIQDGTTIIGISLAKIYIETRL